MPRSSFMKVGLPDIFIFPTPVAKMAQII